LRKTAEQTHSAQFVALMAQHIEKTRLVLFVITTATLGEKTLLEIFMDQMEAPIELIVLEQPETIEATHGEGTLMGILMDLMDQNVGQIHTGI